MLTTPKNTLPFFVVSEKFPIFDNWHSLHVLWFEQISLRSIWRSISTTSRVTFMFIFVSAFLISRFSSSSALLISDASLYPRIPMLWPESHIPHYMPYFTRSISVPSTIQDALKLVRFVSVKQNFPCWCTESTDLCSTNF